MKKKLTAEDVFVVAIVLWAIVLGAAVVADIVRDTRANQHTCEVPPPRSSLRKSSRW